MMPLRFEKSTDRKSFPMLSSHPESCLPEVGLNTLHSESLLLRLWRAASGKFRVQKTIKICQNMSESISTSADFKVLSVISSHFCPTSKRAPSGWGCPPRRCYVSTARRCVLSRCVVPCLNMKGHRYCCSKLTGAPTNPNCNFLAPALLWPSILPHRPWPHMQWTTMLAAFKTFSIYGPCLDRLKIETR